MVRFVQVFYGLFLFLHFAAVQTAHVSAVPPQVFLAPSGVGLNVPLDHDLNSVGYGVDQFQGNGFTTDGNAARTLNDPTQDRFARYGTAIQGQGTSTPLSPNDDWAIEVVYKHSGNHSSSQNPFFIKHRLDETRFFALFSSTGSDSWSLGAGNATGGYTTVASGLNWVTVGTDSTFTTKPSRRRSTHISINN